ncbi:MAG: hypothetical protein OCD76_21000 [Reichenbachiella sp.]
MKKFLFLVLLSACSNKNEIIEKWPNGTFKLLGTEINGKKEGKWIHFRDYNQDTSKVEYYNFGKIYQIDSYAYMAINDSTTTPTTHLSDRTEYQDSLKHGQQLTFNLAGNIDSKSQFVDGKSQGLSTSFYEDGSLQVECVYNKDTITSFKQYYPNGQLLIKAKNPKNGISTFYDSLGNLTFEVRYIDWQPIDTLTTK